MRPSFRCWAEVDLDALRENLSWIRNRVGSDVKVLTVVKADAYGHGLKQIAACLMQAGTDMFGVANLAEARIIRSVGGGWPILMLGALLPEEVEEAVREEVMPTISTLDEAKVFSRAAARLDRKVSIHIKVDTGMGRLGVSARDAVNLVACSVKLPGLVLQGLFTHYASAEDDAGFTRLQRRRFSTVVKRISLLGIDVPCLHANNSSALVHESSMSFDLVRTGLLVYGIVPPGRRKVRRVANIPVRPVLSWKCRVSLVKRIPRGASLSYGRTFIAPQSMLVATVTVGYGDGYPRAASSRAKVLIGGVQCRALGRVTMDQMIVDVSRVPGVKAGDEVVLIGTQIAQTIPATCLARWCGTVPWEILTNISYRVPRIYRGATAA